MIIVFNGNSWKKNDLMGWDAPIQWVSIDLKQTFQLFDSRSL